MEYITSSYIIYDLLKILLGIFILWIGHGCYKSYNYPPGPMGLPFLGYFLMLGKHPYLTFAKLSHKYGDIISIKLKSTTLICISNYHMAKKVFNNPLVLGRPKTSFTYVPGNAGFAGRNGEEWMQQRRFGMNTLKDMGIGNGPWEVYTQEYAVKLVEDLLKTNEQPFDVISTIKLYQMQNIIRLLFGKNIEEVFDEDEFKVVKETYDYMNEFVSPENMIAMPSKWILNLLIRFNVNKSGTLVNNLIKMDAILRREVDKIFKEKCQANQDFTRIYLTEMCERNLDSKPHYFSIDCLVGNLFLFVQSSYDSNATLISWLLLLMTEYTDVQKRIHNEIDEFIGKSGSVYFQDRQKLVYTMATIIEMMRFISPIALTFTKVVAETFTFEGYTFPKGAHVTYNVWSVHHDSRYFKDPMIFEPNRFLSSKGTELIKKDGLGTFSIGKRNCPGEHVAMMNVFITFVKIMQKFIIQMPNGKKTDFTCVFGTALIPKSQELCFIKR